MTQESIPAIGLGTFRLKGNDARDAVRSALSLGFRHIDTARMYENESAVGDGIVSSGIPRRELFLTTKIWYDELGGDGVMNGIRDSLTKLKTDHVDLLLIHWPSPDDEVPMEHYLQALRKARTEGLTRHIGVSNFTCAHLDQAVSILGEGQLLTNQVEVHPFLANRKVVEHASRLGITTTGYMPLAVGKVMEDETLSSIARDRNVTAAQLVLAWCRQRKVVPIPSSTRAEHQKANLEALDLELSAEEIAAIDGLDRGERIADPDFAPHWD